jgi:hypothetical protein
MPATKTAVIRGPHDDPHSGRADGSSPRRPRRRAHAPAATHPTCGYPTTSTPAPKPHACANPAQSYATAATWPPSCNPSRASTPPGTRAETCQRPSRPTRCHGMARRVGPAHGAKPRALTPHGALDSGAGQFAYVAGAHHIFRDDSEFAVGVFAGFHQDLEGGFRGHLAVRHDDAHR